ncbi:cysteine-rich RLK (RECEPTOR-like protein kinase) 10 [Hibiscus trionum]|uniref:non-specific serine/threonine protein kinase n=1 Tax=Hibiscus trionum TaxID=183268 RepID=A0A9W7LUY5_HIBTR|nr:cysteine-rich RLK (RECEPTOR-like protein kinase) 10 [Hibiscus trionum]
MGNFSFSAMLLLILTMFIFSMEVSTNPLFTFCSDNSINYTTNSTFGNNLKFVLDSLPSNTSSTGFYSTSIGDGAGHVYARALCRGDALVTSCRECIKNASRDVLDGCRTGEAIVWYDNCQVQYSFQNSSLMVYTGKFPDSNDNEKNISNPGRFNDVLAFLMNNISRNAAYDSELMFETGEVKFNKKERIYGLVQCTRDISGDTCLNCLNSALQDLNGCCGSRTGGSVLSRNCNVRFQMYKFYNGSDSPLIYPEFPTGDRWSMGMIMGVICAAALVVALLIGSRFIYTRLKKRKQIDEERSQTTLLYELASPKEVIITQEGQLVASQEFPFLDLPTIKAATNDFSDSNKLGQGGFGTVYKGVLPNGKEVAIKRLSRKSWQGLEELKNEVILIAKLQHRNLVRLLGCGLEDDEKLLIFELMPNKSLDFFIFDSEKRSKIEWKTWLDIITGISRGLVYLHEDSRLKIIHRDLKPSNVLLDQDMVAKIADFGMARIFCENQNTANTKRVVGTYGYMAPEYAMEGLFSMKSDVFSFGVIVLEILSGQKNSGFYQTKHAQTLLAYAWGLWNDGKELELVDPCLLESCSTLEIERCIHLGLLCVQEDPTDRPTMSDVVVVLGSDTVTLPEPKRPAFCVGRMIPVDRSSTTDPSMNQMTMSNISAR